MNMQKQYPRNLKKEYHFIQSSLNQGMGSKEVIIVFKKKRKRKEKPKSYVFERKVPLAEYAKPKQLLKTL